MIDDIKDFGRVVAMTIVAITVAGVVIFGLVVILQAVFGPSPETKTAMRVPQLMSEADGCRVYRFVDNGTHYFTRCGAQVETVRNYTENCGKACTRRRTESITTEGNK